MVPTAEILPLVMTTVPFSIGGPLTGYNFPPTIATVCASAIDGDAAIVSVANNVLYEIIALVPVERYEAKLEIGAPLFGYVAPVIE